MSKQPGPNYQRFRWHRSARGWWAQDSQTHRHFIAVTAVGGAWLLKEARENAIGLYDHIGYFRTLKLAKAHCRTLLGDTEHPRTVGHAAEERLQFGQ